jgi:hypothetical protein
MFALHAVLNNLLENREMALEDGRFLVAPKRYDELAAQAGVRLWCIARLFMPPRSPISPDSCACIRHSAW